ncbi:MAG: precorrin-2 C(20)-methyltransferase [Desulfovibrio sp.]|nr:precorrin-2 C(20)-methyltransferase [Desulfovibrio sp.]MBI4960697.1 precorrin-2 C(20)-methyltransferase [Desulfovibrio sp.]
MERGTLYAVGVGPGDPELLTLKAVKVLNHVGVVFAAASTKNDHSLSLSIAAPHMRPDTPVIRLGFPMTRNPVVLEEAWRTNALLVIDHLSKGEDAAFITLGDPMTYSTFLYLWRTMQNLLPDLAVEIVPGVSSIHAAAAAAGFGLAESGQNLAILSGVDEPERLRQALEACDSAVILKAYRSFPALREMLSAMGLSENAVLVSQCGLEGQAIVRGLADCPERPPYFSLLLVKK